MTLSSKPENMLKWIEALESGDFVQTTGRLEAHDDGQVRHCCLGVAARVAMANGVALQARKGSLGSVRFLWEHDHMTINEGSATSLPYPVSEWLGLSHEAAYLANPLLYQDTASGISFTCMDANDNYNMTFAQIAKHLRRRYLGELVELTDEDFPKPQEEE